MIVLLESGASVQGYGKHLLLVAPANLKMHSETKMDAGEGERTWKISNCVV